LKNLPKIKEGAPAAVKLGPAVEKLKAAFKAASAEEQKGLLTDAGVLFGKEGYELQSKLCGLASEAVKTLISSKGAHAEAVKMPGEVKIDVIVPAEENDMEKLRLVSEVVGALTGRTASGPGAPLSPQETVEALTLGQELKAAAQKPKGTAWIPSSELGKPAEGKPLVVPELAQPAVEQKMGDLTMMTEHGVETTADTKAPEKGA
ncbi:MAG: hypothetical protein WC759_02475, partial [Candidatus Micrarchaeia archaeon]